MSLIEFAKRTAVRRVIYVLVGVALAWVGIGRADAQTCSFPSYSPPTVNGLANKQVAYSTCSVGVPAVANISGYARDFAGCTQEGLAPTAKEWRQKWVSRHVNGNCSSVSTATAFFGHFTWVGDNCPVNTEWDEASHTCKTVCPAGEVPDPSHPGQCLSDDDCLARNAGITGPGSRAWSSRCISGCNLVVTEATKTSFGGQEIWRGFPQYDGQTCTDGVVQEPDPDGVREDEKNKPQECVATGAGSRACVKSNGDQCYTTSAGKQTCWKPGELGTKTDGPIAQVRQPGLVTAPPDIVLPNNDTAAKTGDSVPTTTTKPGGSVVNNTVTNYVSNSGNNAGDKDQGESDDGTGTTPGDDDKPGTSTGGADCAAPPATAGGDPLLRAQIEQTWRVRCPHGLNPLPSASAAGAQGTDAHPGVDDVVIDGGVADAIAAGGDDAGFGLARSCPLLTLPQLVIGGSVVPFPAALMCEWLSVLAALILIMGHVAWAMIIVHIGAK